MSSTNEMRIVLIGRTGNGKSSVGNSLLHSRSAFHAMQSASSITKDCQVRKYEYRDNYGQQKKLTVVDTPGFFDTQAGIKNDVVEKRIASQIFDMTAPGVHAFLIVIRIGRFSPEERETVDFIRHIFGADAVRYCIVIFTHEDQLEDGQSLDNFISTSPELRQLVNDCGGRKFAINNRLSGELLTRKTNQLIEMVNTMIRNNQGTYYTNAEYQRIEKQRQEAEKKRREEEERKKKAEQDAIIARTRDEERKKAKERETQTRNEERKKAQERENQTRDEERKKAQERENQARDEERKKAQERENQLQRELDEARRSRSRNSDNDHLMSSLLGAMALNNSTSRTQQCDNGTPFYSRTQQCDNGTPYFSPVQYGGMGMSSPSSSMGSGFARGGHNGRFTGEFMATSGAANGRPIYEGARGGQYYMSESGNKSYIRK